ncbi:hypothetical protein EJ02DRAFT_213634 [Clathrospora elynae]|uniref:Uncharacterized protein n=1 Tax=Clathrospora elynae TaxID=706981 RepID=A0A6A5SJW9_9PLEO|nr:hypothetical protein EJ02DRAFT_213634 [Clathrospora elynae]
MKTSSPLPCAQHSPSPNPHASVSHCCRHVAKYATKPSPSFTQTAPSTCSSFPSRSLAVFSQSFDLELKTTSSSFLLK